MSKTKMKSVKSTTNRIISKVESGDYDRDQIEHMIQSLITNRDKVIANLKKPEDKPITKRQANMVCGGKVEIEEVFTAMDYATDKFMEIHGNKVNRHSSRYKLFKEKGTVCVSCGLPASYFKLERFPTDKTFHLNLYGIDHLGDEVLFTKDHNIPRAHGGPNNISNYQTMCSPCNAEKGSKHE